MLSVLTRLEEHSLIKRLFIMHFNSLPIKEKANQQPGKSHENHGIYIYKYHDENQFFGTRKRHFVLIYFSKSSTKN